MINGKIVNDYLDVFKKAGCATAYTENYEITANGPGSIQITITAIKQNTMISMIKITPSSGKATQSPLPPPPRPPPPPGPVIQKIVIDTGSKTKNNALVAGDTWAFGKADAPEIKGAGVVPQTYFRTHRSSNAPLKYTVPGLTVGASYAVKLGFAEIWKPNCNKGKRIMSIKLNGIIVTSNLGIFGAAGSRNSLSGKPRCNSKREWTACH
jgi:hypothetical protein